MTTYHIVGHMQDWSWDQWMDMTHEGELDTPETDSPPMCSFTLIASLDRYPNASDCESAVRKLHEECDNAEGAAEALGYGILDDETFHDLFDATSSNHAGYQPLDIKEVKRLYSRYFRERDQARREEIMSQIEALQKNTPPVGTWTECPFRGENSRLTQDYPSFPSKRW